MTDFAPEPEPAWTPELQDTFDRFVATGGTPEQWAAANPELVPPAQTQPKPAEADVWAAIREDMRAAADASARANFAWKQRKSQRGRQTR